MLSVNRFCYHAPVFYLVYTEVSKLIIILIFNFCYYTICHHNGQLADVTIPIATRKFCDMLQLHIYLTIILP